MFKRNANGYKTIGRVRFALTDQGLSMPRTIVLLFLGVTLLSMLLSGGVTSTQVGFLAVFVVLAMTMFAYSYSSYPNIVSLQHDAEATKWVRAGKNESEVRRRRELVAAQGATAALATAGIVLPSELAAVNVDGTPMLPGQYLDVNGRIYGDGSPLVDRIFSSEVGTGMTLDTSSAYSSPMGLSSSGGLSSGSGSSGGLD